MYEIQKVKLPDKIENYELILREAAKKNWSYTGEKFGHLWFEREIKQTNAPIAGKETEDYKEFISFYKKEINNKASSAKTIPRKYELALKDKDDEGVKVTHKYIMDNLKDYKLYLKAFNKPPVGVQVYLNQRRYIEKYETEKVNYEEKWIFDIMEERKIDQYHQNKIIERVRIWRKSYESIKEFTTNVLDSMIVKIWENKDYS